MSSEALGNLSELLKSACADRPELGPAYPHARCKVIKNGKLVFDETASAAGYEHPDDDSIYRYYSMSKIVTTVAIVQCYERGLLQLSDPVSKYIPAFGQTKVFASATRGPAPEPLASLGIPEVPVELQTTALERQMTINDLLIHTSGLGYGGLGLSAGYCDDVDLWYILNGLPGAAVAGACFGASDAYSSLEGVCDVIAGLPLKFQPGSKFEYGIGHFVCGRIIEVVSGHDFLTYLEKNIFSKLGMSTASFGEDGATCKNLLKIYAYGPNELTGAVMDLGAQAKGESILNVSKSGNLVEMGSTLPAEMHFDHCKRSEYIKAVKARTAPIAGDAGMTGTADDFFKFTCMLVNGGTGANGARVLGRKTIELMYKNHLPGGASIAEMENKVNSASFGLFSDGFFCSGMGFGLGGAVPIGDRHQVEDGVLAMQPGSYSWAGIAGTDVIVDPENDLAIIFYTQTMLSGMNHNVNGMLGHGLHARFVYGAVQ
jgi:CubicO group peptidase (beta-lactamase class C family)